MAETAQHAGQTLCLCVFGEIPLGSRGSFCLIGRA